MANSYTTVPAIIPGNVQIGGNLTVGGSTFKLGSNPRKYRIQELANGDFYETVNLDTIAVAQDDVTSGSQRRRCNPAVHYHSLETEGAGSPAVHTLRIDMQAGLIYLVSDNVRGGVASPYIRLAKNAVGIPALTMNLSSDLATRDDGAKPALALIHDEVTPKLYQRLVNAAGAVQDTALVETLWTDSTQHAITGVTGNQTVGSHVIRGNTLGANGLIMISIVGLATTSASGSQLYIVNLGGTTMTCWNLGSSQSPIFQIVIWIGAANATNAQNVEAMVTYSGGGAPLGVTQAWTVDMTVDQTLSFIVNPGNVADACYVKVMQAQLINSFGPV